MLYPNFLKKRTLRISQAREVLDNLEEFIPSGNQGIEGCIPYLGCMAIIVFSIPLLSIEILIATTIWALYRDVIIYDYGFSTDITNIATVIIILAIFVPIAAYILKTLRIFSLSNNYNTNVWNTYLKMLAEGEVLDGTVASFTGDKKYRHIEYVFTSSTGQKIHWKYTTRRRVYLKAGETISVLYLSDDTYSLI